MGSLEAMPDVERDSDPRSQISFLIKLQVTSDACQKQVVSLQVIRIVIPIWRIAGTQ
jgi:hypothetical protein